MKQLCYLVLFCGILQSSCTKSPTENEENNIPSEDTGLFLHYYGWGARHASLTWSKNTDELFIAGEKGIQAIDLSTLSVRTIKGTDWVNNSFGDSWDLSHDGNTLYYLLTGSDGHGPLYRISIDGHNRQLLDDNECSELCLSLDDSYLAYYVYHPGIEGMADSLYTFKIASNEKIFLGIGCPLTFTPDSKSLLYYYWTHPDTTPSQSSFVSYSITSIENADTYPISIDTPYYAAVPKCFCDNSGIYVLYWPEILRCSVRNITTNETIYTWTENCYAYGPSYTFSTLGTKIAYYSSAWGEYALNLVDLSSKKESCIAYSQQKCGAHSIAFSPDDSKIAFAFGECIYMKEIP